MFPDRNFYHLTFVLLLSFFSCSENLATWTLSLAFER
jgi:hypothetical protein